MAGEVGRIKESNVTHSPVFDAIKRGESVTFVDGKGDAQLQPSIQAVNKAIRLGASDSVKQLLAVPKNRPYYRKFAKAKF